MKRMIRLIGKVPFGNGSLATGRGGLSIVSCRVPSLGGFGLFAISGEMSASTSLLDLESLLRITRGWVHLGQPGFPSLSRIGRGLLFVCSLSHFLLVYPCAFCHEVVEIRALVAGIVFFIVGVGIR